MTDRHVLTAAPGVAVVASERASDWLDLFRWVAALAVVITHVNNRLFVPVMSLPVDERSLLAYGWAFAAGFAHQAVMVFFVLSGHLVGGALWLEVRATGTVDLKGYFAKRLSRLGVVMLPALAIGALFDALGAALIDGRAGIYPPAVAQASTPAVWLCNAVFLQTIACPQFGSNGALWSLANEFWYYVLWPLLLAPLMHRRPALQRAAMLVLAVAILAMLANAQYAVYAIVPYLLPWLIGVLPVLGRGPWVGRTVGQALLLFLGVLLVVRIGVRGPTWEERPWLGYALDLCVAISFANLLAAIGLARAAAPLRGRLLHRWAAGFSYSLYAIHTPTLNLLAATAVIGAGVGWQMPPTSALATGLAVAYVGVCIGVAFVFSLATEAQTARVRRFILTRMRH